ncbi:MAG: hypothetical protein NZM11_01225 [Anaerolineales bacterium]|nr:hypothetical protein [Anaerolineales bacterium]
MATPNSGPLAGSRQLLLDRFHTGVRLASLLWWVLATGAIYLAGITVWQALFGTEQGWFWMPWIIITLLLSQPVGHWGEQQLMRLWPSGRTLSLAGARLTLTEKSGGQTFNLDRKLNYWRWYFIIRERRAGRVPNGHYCCALRLMQDDGVAASANVSLYAFFPPERARALLERFPGYELRPVTPARLPTSPQAAPVPIAGGHLAGRDPAFLTAERMRWESGAELEPDDFEFLLQHLQQHLPEFRAVSS